MKLGSCSGGVLSSTSLDLQHGQGGPMCIPPFRNEGCPGGFKELGSSAPGCFCSCVFLQSIHFTVVNDRKRCDLFIDGMDLVKSFVPGRLDLSDLLKAFFLDLGPFL